MTARRPPTLRDPQNYGQRLSNGLRAMAKGSDAGRVLSASPVTWLDAADAPDLDLSPAGDAGAELAFLHDRFPTTGTLTGAATSLTLTAIPTANSLHLYLNGLELDEGTDYTLSGNTVTVLAAAETTAGDVLEARYAYDGVVVTTLATLVDFAATGWKYSTAAQLNTDYATDGAEGSTTWAGPTFDDSAWSTGQAPFGWGYAGGVGATPRNTTLSALSEVFMRKTLPGGGSLYEITIKIDNWAYLYFNGHRVDGTTASGAHNGSDLLDHQTKGPFAIPDAWVRSDFNVVALHVQDAAGGGGYGSGDILIADMKVTAYR